MEVVRTSKLKAGNSQATYVRTSVNPEQDKHHSCGHTVDEIDLQVDAQVSCHNRNEVKDEPFRN